MGQLKQLEQQILDEWRRFAESKHDAEEFSEDGLLWISALTCTPLSIMQTDRGTEEKAMKKSYG